MVAWTSEPTCGPASQCRGENQREKSRSRPVSRVLSWATIHLGPLSPATSSDLPESIAGRDLAFLLGLAPGGVYLAARVATCAVRSYRTLSPLPSYSASEQPGGLLSVALSVGSRPPGVTWHPALWSPDFPPFPRKSGCPADSDGYCRR